MAGYKAGDRAIVVVDGTEVEAELLGFWGTPEQGYMVQLAGSGEIQQLPKERLLPVKAPFFDVRGLVFTTSSLHPGEQGEIVSIGRGPKGKMFYRVKFADGSTEWISEDGILIEG